MAAVASSASASLNQAGPVDPISGFPARYSGSNGLALQLCQEGRPNCLSGPENIRDTHNAGGDAEAFYYAADADVGPISVMDHLEAACGIDVTYTPRAGTSTAAITVTDGSTGSPRTVALKGSSLGVMTVDRTGIAFGNQKVGTTSATETVVVGNDGVAPLSVAVPTLSGTGASHFKIASNGCTALVDPTSGCEIAVAFAPTTSGSKTATLNIKDASGTTKTVALTGTGTQPTINLSTTSLAFPDTDGGHDLGGAVGDGLQRRDRQLHDRRRGLRGYRPDAFQAGHERLHGGRQRRTW